jgi:uridine phosphorylase
MEKPGNRVGAMPSRLRPTAPYAADAILVGDPGRALLLAQEVLEQPKMCNHARGLWGYSGRTARGDELTIQSTGIGGPSAALVLADLAELGVRRAIRVGSCVGGGERPAGELILVERAVASRGSASAFGLAAGEEAMPDPGLTDGLRLALGERCRPGAVASYDMPPPTGEPLADGIDASDMQTVAVLARAAALGIGAAAVLVVTGSPIPGAIAEEVRESAERRAGQAASGALSTSS